MANIADAFDTFNTARCQSKVLDRVWRAAYGDEYAEDARPDAFYPLSVLDQIIAVGDEMAAGRTLMDVGCGHGLTGLYLARRLKARLCGIDVSLASIELARRNAGDADSDVRFWVADATKTGLEDGTCSLITCLDVLLYIPDKTAAFKELYRVLSPGGAFAFTTWEQSGYSARLGADQVADHRPLLEEAGFRIATYEVVSEWRERQRQAAEGIIEHAQELREEVGERAASMFVNMAKGTMTDMDKRRYVFGLARKLLAMGGRMAGRLMHLVPSRGKSNRSADTGPLQQWTSSRGMSRPTKEPLTFEMPEALSSVMEVRAYRATCPAKDIRHDARKQVVTLLHPSV